MNKSSLLSVLFFSLGAVLAQAGTPLICHPYDIGRAKSLPGGESRGTDPGYDRTHLVDDTLALLTPDAPVIVRMETLRRAVIYATGNLRMWEGRSYTSDDRQIAAALLARLRERTQSVSEATADLALFDLGFFAETLRQTQLDPALDGYALLMKVAERRPHDADLQFALALAGSYPERKPGYQSHLNLARAGAKPGTLLAANLESHFIH